MDLALHLTNLTAAAYMTGVIWLVQLVVYPQFRSVAEIDFVGHHKRHTRGIAPVVLPVMVLEMLAAGALVVRSPGNWIAWAGAALAVLIWVVTFGLIVPLHNHLGSAGKDLRRIDRMLALNWVRTAAWTGRLGLALYWFATHV